MNALLARVLTLPGVSTGDSCAMPGARAFILDPALAVGPPAAFQCETDFAHLHPPGDDSPHIRPAARRLPAPCRRGLGRPASARFLRGHRHRRKPPRTGPVFGVLVAALGIATWAFIGFGTIGWYELSPLGRGVAGTGAILGILGLLTFFAVFLLIIWAIQTWAMNS